MSTPSSPHLTGGPRRLSRRAAGRSLVATMGLCAWPKLLDAAPTFMTAPAAGEPIRLGANENANGLGPDALEAIRAGLADANRYPGESQQRFVSDLAAMHGVTREQLVISPGSGEILRAATVAFTSPTRALVSAAGLSVSASAASLADRANVEKQKALNREGRAFARLAFESSGYHVLPSEANFLMVDVGREVSGVQALCREAGVVIARAFPPLSTHARITIGTMDEMRRALALILPTLATPASARLHVGAAAPAAWDGECC